MNVKFKMSLIIIGTLLVGIVLGALLQGAIYRQKFENRLVRMRTPEGFVNRFYRILEPTPEQKPKVDRILRESFEQLEKQVRPPVTGVREILDSLKTQLAPILTPQQNERLKHHLDRMSRFSKHPPGERRGRRGGRPDRELPPDRPAPPPGN